MRSVFRCIVPFAVIVSFAAACSDATAPATQPAARGISAPSAGASFARPRGNNPGTPPFPATLNLAGGAHFVLGFSLFTGWIYFPANAAAFALAPHGLTTAGARIP